MKTVLHRDTQGTLIMSKQGTVEQIFDLKVNVYPR